MVHRLEEIDANLRFCAYNVGDMDTDVDELIRMRTSLAKDGSLDLAEQLDVSGSLLSSGSIGCTLFPGFC